MVTFLINLIKLCYTSDAHKGDISEGENIIFRLKYMLELPFLCIQDKNSHKWFGKKRIKSTVCAWFAILMQWPWKRFWNVGHYVRRPGVLWRTQPCIEWTLWYDMIYFPYSYNWTLCPTFYHQLSDIRVKTSDMSGCPTVFQKHC